MANDIFGKQIMRQLSTGPNGCKWPRIEGRVIINAAVLLFSIHCPVIRFFVLPKKTGRCASMFSIIVFNAGSVGHSCQRMAGTALRGEKGINLNILNWDIRGFVEYISRTFKCLLLYLGLFGNLLGILNMFRGRRSGWTRSVRHSPRALILNHFGFGGNGGAECRFPVFSIDKNVD